MHIPKTGGTTIEQVFHLHFPEDFVLFSADAHFQKKLPMPIHSSPALRELFEQRAKDRGFLAKSSPQHYTYGDIQKLVPDLDSWFSFTFIRNPWERLFSEWKFSCLITQTESADFPGFVTKVEEALRNDCCARNNHYRPQMDFLATNVRLYRYENFASEARGLFALLGIRVKTLPHIYRTTEKDEYKRFYDRALITRVRELYQRDVDALGYVF